jgi:hypothetical protein
MVADSLNSLIDRPQFHAALVAGLLLLAVLAPLALERARRGRSAGVAGIGFTLAAVIGITGAGPFPGHRHVPAAFVGGLVLAFVLTAFARRVAGTGTGGALLLAVAAAPGAAVVAGSLTGVAGWVRAVVALTGALAGAGAADFDHAWRGRGLGPVLVLVTAGAVYSTVPDTEGARALVGAALPLAVLAWPTLQASLGASGAVTSMCVIAWVVGQDGAARPGAVIGGAGAVGLFVLEPITRRIRPTTRPRAVESPALEAIHLVGIQVVVAFGAARFAGLEHDAGAAALRLLIVAVVGLILTYGLPAVDAARGAGAVRPPPDRVPRQPGRAPLQ